MCDSEIEPVDFKCYNCNTLRSRVNEERYTGKTPLEDLKEMDTGAQPNTIGLVDCTDPNASKLGKGGGGGGVLDDEEEDGANQKGIKGRIWRNSRTLKRTLKKNKSFQKGMLIGEKLGRKARKSFQKD